jgi:hypothetical protein
MNVVLPYKNSTNEVRSCERTRLAGVGRVETLGQLEHHTPPKLLHCSLLLDGFYLFEGLGINSQYGRTVGRAPS